MSDRVDHPPHYGGKDDPYETIKVLEAWLTPQEFAGGLKFNALKYMSRHRAKGGAEDLENALWYQNALADFVRRTGYQEVYPKPLYWSDDGETTEDDGDIIGLIETAKVVQINCSVEPHVRFVVRFPTSDDGDSDVETFFTRDQADSFVKWLLTPKSKRKARRRT